MPVPDRLLLCVPALSVTVTVAVRAPSADGVKVTLMVQLELPASVVPQLLPCAKSPAFVPVTATLSPVTAEVPLLVSVSGCEPLVVPTLVAEAQLLASASRSDTSTEARVCVPTVVTVTSVRLPRDGEVT